jgi:hypothetical protein
MTGVESGDRAGRERSRPESWPLTVAVRARDPQHLLGDKVRLTEQKPGPPATVGLFLPETLPLPISPSGIDNV